MDVTTYLAGWAYFSGNVSLGYPFFLFGAEIKS